MEVHHHSHTDRKKWSHFFWEFLMLFLAVFCGFLAEYQLEHVIEHNREKEYMRSMVEDLQQDTTEINRAVLVISGYGSNSDSLLSLLESFDKNDKNQLKKIYTLHYSIGAELASLSQRTIAQLKNSGGMRLIRKKNVADSITLYDTKSQYLSAVFKSYDEVSSETFKSGALIFDNKYIRHGFKTEPISFLTYEVPVIRTYANYLYTFRAVGSYYINYLGQQKALAIKLADLIKKEYQLK
ncbi:MAG TPA: hypothetical protein VFH08_11135 [Chitinophagaceae bacterium]|nr:hypothetical protein [Chitinophagaceae bacterium]